MGGGGAGAGAGGAGPGALWRAGLAPALLGGGLAALLAALTGKHDVVCPPGACAD